MVNVRDQFDSMVEARDAVRRFILDDGESYGYGPGSKSDKKRTIMTCKETTCKFRIRIIAGKKGVKVTKMLPHTCTPATHYKSKPVHSMWYLKEHHRASIIDNRDITPAQIRSNERLRFSNQISYM